jgi:hypothetical protein
MRCRRIGVWAYRRTRNAEIVGEAARFVLHWAFVVFSAARCASRGYLTCPLFWLGGHGAMIFDLAPVSGSAEPHPQRTRCRRIGVWAYGRTRNAEIVGEAARFASLETVQSGTLRLYDKQSIVTIQSIRVHRDLRASLSPSGTRRKGDRSNIDRRREALHE